MGPGVFGTCSEGRDIGGVSVPHMDNISCPWKVLSILLARPLPKWRLPCWRRFERPAGWNWKEVLQNRTRDGGIFLMFLGQHVTLLSHLLNGKGEKVNPHPLEAKGTAVVITHVEIACFITKLLWSWKHVQTLHFIPASRFDLVHKSWVVLCQTT